MASIQIWETVIMVRWPTASVATPSGMANRTNGRLDMVCTMLTRTGLSVSEVMVQAAPRLSITRPRLKTRLAVQTLRNCRWPKSS